MINTVVAKYCDHVPLYRQAVMLEREAGVEIGRATLDGRVLRVGDEGVARVFRLQINPPEGGQITFGGIAGGLALSPDGRTAAYVASAGGRTAVGQRNSTADR